ncbi:putative lipid-binding transport protein (Tim44 family) [Humitalea rosea]|uniref:Putative lipid-binding transport protein (Tim44 family) n=1 Tax=Humitalea rosea TaxID=990373 RepID=A0A2W7IJH9_9PROT|nr:TIM44-like domain-containing protein [Humitalea rosea]PZW47114.1 putative lipid-binding transport protein (Tim44 family) [Humitalea rosea]
MSTPRRPRRTARLLAAFATLALVLAPAFADARPGGGISSGSRGSRSFSAPPATTTAPRQAQPMDRTLSQPSAPRPGVAGAAGPVSSGGFGRGLMGGIAGGLLGAGLFGMLSGSGFLGGLGSLAGMMGFLLQVALIGGAIFLVMRLLRRSAPRPAMAGGPSGSMPRSGMARMMEPGGGMRPAMGAGMGPSSVVEILPNDFEAFQRLLVEVNAAWSRRDAATLERIATHEMAEYFANDLRDLTARGWANQTRDVALEKGDLAEAWAEGRDEYATVAMRFSLIDVTTRIADGVVVEGDPAVRQTATELWTFVRRDGGEWRLSAIQQSS